MSNVKLPAEVAEQYELVNWVGGYRQTFGRYGVVDVSTITLRRADALVRAGFSKLRRKPTPIAPASSASSLKKEDDKSSKK